MKVNLYTFQYKQCDTNHIIRNDLLCVEWDVKHYTLTHSPLT